MIKEKKCKGHGKAKDFKGCGTPTKVEYLKYGLCQSCYSSWIISDDPMAQKTFKSFLINHKKKFEKIKNQESIEVKTALKSKLETKSDLEKKLQKEINLIVRLIDKGHLCISSGRELGKSYDAGHLFTTKAQPTIRFNLFNIFAQSVHDNQHKSGNELEYFFRIGELFGKEFQDFVVSLKHIKAIHLSKEELKEKIDIARSLVKWLKLQDRIFTKEERLSIRSDMNNQLGIYDQEYCEFKI
jgi:hypothetical protein